MCRRTTCANEHCQKATWIGCGQHIPYALQGVPEDQVCTCEPHNPAPLPPRDGPPPDYTGFHTK